METTGIAYGLFETLIGIILPFFFIGLLVYTVTTIKIKDHTKKEEANEENPNKQ